eukprot:m.1030063 g.1030063  ORF g.1030063 m.1030063 type:complete len:52 (-) comp24116_c0_seq2:268-423(-)
MSRSTYPTSSPYLYEPPSDPLLLPLLVRLFASSGVEEPDLDLGRGMMGQYF